MTSVGQTWRDGLFLCKLEAEQSESISFPFGPGFGCGQLVKVNQGQKFTLQTQHKLTSQIGAKLALGGAELSSGAGFEVSETVTHEFSAGFEWSYTAMPCQYCNPKIYFTAARLR